jgi:Ig-like domain-containing protein
MLVCSYFHRARRWLTSRDWIWAVGLFALAPLLGSAQTQQSYSIELQPGFNSIANHLIRGSNTLNEVIPNAPDGSRLFKWNPATQDYYAPAQFIRGQWVSQELAMQFLKPGEGAFLQVTQNQSAPLTFSGFVTPHYSLPRQAVVEYNCVSPHLPRPMSFIELFGFPPLPGDIVYLYENAVAALPYRKQQYPVSTHKFTPQGWDTVPEFKFRRSAFVYLSRAPRILIHPKSQATSAGETIRLEVAALGAAPLEYQWLRNEDDLIGETNPYLLLSNIKFLQSGLYSVTVRNFLGETTSKQASIRVSSPPVILEPPHDIRAIPGQFVRFSVKAVGTPPLRYQWYYKDTQLLPNQTQPTLEFTATQSQAGRYHVVVMNDLDPPAQSQPVVLEVNIPPQITNQPVSRVASLGDTVAFTVEATGTQPLSYHWRHNGQRIPWAAGSTLIISNVQPKHAGEYDVVVANVAGVAPSQTVKLILNVEPIFLSDSIAGSQLFPMPVFTGRGDNLHASNEVDEIHCERVGGSSVWLRWTPQERGIVRFETSGSSFDTVLAAYVMNAAGSLLKVTCDDDQGEAYGSRIHFVAFPNTIYHVAIDGLDGATGEIIVDWEFFPTPESLPIINQQPRDQTVRTNDPVIFSVFATGSPGVPLSYQWFHNGDEIFGANEPQFRISAVDENDLGYYQVAIAEGRQVVMSRRALLQISVEGVDNQLVQAFAVDKFADAVFRSSQPLPLVGGGGIQSVATTSFTPVFGYTGTQIFSTVGFSNELGELSHCSIPGGASAWFVMVATNNGQLYLNTVGSSFNTVLAVYTGPGPTIKSLTAVECDDDSGPGTTSSLDIPVIKDNIYYIAVDGYNGVSGTAHLNYRLLIPMTLTQLAKTNETTCRFRVTATPAYPFTLQRCVGLSSWLDILTTNRPNGIFNYLDTNAGIQKKFYRVVQTP